NLVFKSFLPAVLFGTLSNFSFAVCFAVSNVWINASTSVFSSSVTKPSAFISVNFVSTAVFACSAFLTACSASDYCCVSKTPLLSASFISGDVTDAMLSNLVCSLSFPTVLFGTLSTFSFAACFAVSNAWINWSTADFSSGVTKPSAITSDNLVSTVLFACSAFATALLASDNWSVSNTPLLSASFTSGDTTEAILLNLIFKSVLPAVPFGTLSSFSFASCFAVSNAWIS